MGEVLPPPSQAPPNTAAGPPIGVDLNAFTLAYLQSHEAECPACGYNVHRLTQARCPECGRPLAVQVVADTGGYTAAWLVLLTATACTAGIGVVMTVFVARWGWPPRPLAASVTYFLCNVPVPLLVLWLRRRLVRMSRAIQWVLAAGCVVAPLVAAVVFFGNM